MAVELYAILDEYNLTHRLLAVTTDNCSNNGSMRRALSERFESEGYAWNAAANTIPCFAHVIQLAVKDLLDSLKASAANESITLSFDENNLRQITQETSLSNTLLKVYRHVLSNRYF